MYIFILKLLLLPITYLNAKQLLLTQQWDNDVYTGRHFDELVSDENRTAVENCVLLLYAPSCDSKLREELFNTSLPPIHSLIFTKYDYASTPSYVWYHIDAKDDLYGRYKPKECMELFFFPKGTSLDSPKRFQVNQEQKLSDAIWNVIKVQFKIRNKFGRPVAVQLEVRNEVISAGVLNHTQNHTALAYATHAITVKHTRYNRLLYAQVMNCNMNGSEIVIERPEDRQNVASLNEEEWRKSVERDIAATTSELETRSKRLAQQYLHDLKQPSVAPIFTENGYTVQNIPPYIFNRLFENYIAKRSDQEFIKRLGQKNSYNIPLDNDAKSKISVVVKMLVENWSDVDLELTRTTEFREHETGVHWPSHLANIGTQVIGVVMVLKYDLGESEENWPIEVVAYDGVRKNVTLKEREMLFYEPSNVMIGRPYPFKGRLCVTFGMFFRPSDNWKWRISHDNRHYMFDNKEKEPLHVLATVRTLRRAGMRGMKDEL